MKTIRALCLLLIATLALACGEGAATEAETEATQRGDASPAVNRTYDESVRERACEVIPVELVAKLFEIPAETLEPGGGKRDCRYRLETDERTFYAELSSMRVFDDVEKAKRRYADFTRDATQEEVDAQKEEADREIEEEEALETETEKKTAWNLTGLMAAMTPEGGLRHVPVEGLADEAKIDNEAGILRIRSGNLMFYISAYNGPRKPRPGTTNMDEIMAAELEWNAKILPDRTRAAIQLAREVVPRIEALSN